MRYGDVSLGKPMHILLLIRNGELHGFKETFPKDNCKF